MTDDQKWEAKTLVHIVASESRRRARYIDPMGIPSVGIGFNLLRSDAIDKLTRLGADWRAIMDGAGELTDPQIDRLFSWCWVEALAYARQLFPNWEQLPAQVRTVLADMSFQMRGRLAGFVRLRAAVAELDYLEVVNQMRLSRYAQQCPDRVARNAALIEAAIAELDTLDVELDDLEVDDVTAGGNPVRSHPEDDAPAPVDRSTPKDRSVR